MQRMPRLQPAVLVFAVAFLLIACNGGGGEPEATATIDGTAPSTPAPTATEPPTPAAAGPNTGPDTAIALPEGFTAYTIAEGFSRPTSIARAPDGTLYISERHGRVLRLADENGDGVFETLVPWSDTPEEITGLLAAPDGGLYVSRTGEVLLVSDTDGDGVGDSSRQIVGGLPSGRHQNNGLVLGPDGKLYLTNGSTCDDTASDCPPGGEANPMSATILQANADGSGVRVYASGLRNPYDIVFDGQGRLWATDNGSDAPCGSIDELNLIVDGGDYGWPYGDACDPHQAGLPPVASLGLHTAATGIDVYDAEQFPARYRSDLFLTLWGSFFAVPELAPALYRVALEEGPAGPQGTVEQFASGFINPIDVVVDGDGTLLVLDYGSGTLYRIVYTGG